jgi:hypothetical protein
MSEVKVNKISPRSGTTVTLGDSGDTFTIPSGATINNQGTATNFGPTGSVSWQTTVKTSGFTATAGEGYFVDTSSGAVSVNLPAGTAGAVVGFKDYLNSFDTNALTLVQNGSDKIGGSTVNATLDTEGLAVTLVFVDSTRGWLVTDSGLQSESPTEQYVTATGGTIITCGNFKIHAFTGPGTFCVSNAGNAGGSNTVDYMVVAGGGGGGGHSSAGGGGGGGFRESPGAASGCYTASPLGASPAVALPVSVQGYSIAVGGGGPGGPGSSPGLGTNGSVSTFSTITSAGGGAGGAWPSPQCGSPGGSGGGAGNTNTEGTGNQPPVNPPQGQPGQGGNNSCGGGGGGGATAAGSVGSPPNNGGPGGAGATTAITTSSSYGEATPTPGRAYAGGGGGRGGTSATRAQGGLGGGGNGNLNDSGGDHGTTNTGGGGGGNGNGSSGANGGSGIVMIRYKFQ